MILIHPSSHAPAGVVLTLSPSKGEDNKGTNRTAPRDRSPSHRLL